MFSIRNKSSLKEFKKSSVGATIRTIFQNKRICPLEADSVDKTSHFFN
jgi:hypothetical protein